jgi:hypothetical protein
MGNVLVVSKLGVCGCMHAQRERARDSFLRNQIYTKKEIRKGVSVIYLSIY